MADNDVEIQFSADVSGLVSEMNEALDAFKSLRSELASGISGSKFREVATAVKDVQSSLSNLAARSKDLGSIGGALTSSLRQSVSEARKAVSEFEKVADAAKKAFNFGQGSRGAVDATQQVLARAKAAQAEEEALLRAHLSRMADIRRQGAAAARAANAGTPERKEAAEAEKQAAKEAAQVDKALADESAKVARALSAIKQKAAKDAASASKAAADAQIAAEKQAAKESERIEREREAFRLRREASDSSRPQQDAHVVQKNAFDESTRDKVSGLMGNGADPEAMRQEAIAAAALAAAEQAAGTKAEFLQSRLALVRGQLADAKAAYRAYTDELAKKYTTHDAIPASERKRAADLGESVKNLSLDMQKLEVQAGERLATNIGRLGGAFHGAGVGAGFYARELHAVLDESLSGRYGQMQGTLANIGFTVLNQLGALKLATLGWLAPLAAVGAAAGVVLYQMHAVAQAAKETSNNLAFAGNGANFGGLDQLDQVSKKAVQAGTAWKSFADIFGYGTALSAEDAGKLADAMGSVVNSSQPLIDLSEDMGRSFKELFPSDYADKIKNYEELFNDTDATLAAVTDKVHNLSEAQKLMVKDAQASGDASKKSAAVAAVAAGQMVQALKTQIATREKELAAAKKQYDEANERNILGGLMGDSSGITKAEDAVKRLTDEIKKLHDEIDGVNATKLAPPVDLSTLNDKMSKISANTPSRQITAMSGQRTTLETGIAADEARQTTLQNKQNEGPLDAEETAELINLVDEIKAAKEALRELNTGIREQGDKQKGISDYDRSKSQIDKESMLPAGLMDAVHAIESSNGKNAAGNVAIGRSGNYAMGGSEWGAYAAPGASKNNEADDRDASTNYMLDIQRKLLAAGQQATAANLYLGYQQGTGAAVRMLNADPNDPVSKYSKNIGNNGGDQNGTVQQFLDLIARKVDRNGAPSEATGSSPLATLKAQKDAADQNVLSKANESPEVLEQAKAAAAAAGKAYTEELRKSEDAGYAARLVDAKDNLQKQLELQKENYKRILAANGNDVNAAPVKQAGSQVTTAQQNLDKFNNDTSASDSKVEYEERLKNIKLQQDAAADMFKVFGLGYAKQLTQAKEVYSQEMDAANQYYSKLKEMYGEDSTEWNRYKREQVQDTKKYAEEQAQATKQANEKMEESYKSYAEGIASTVGSGIMKIIQHQGTMGQLFKSVLTQMLSSFVNLTTKLVADWAAKQAAMLAKAVLTKDADVAATVTGEAAKTAAVGAGGAAQAAQTVAAVGKSIMASAGETFAGIFGFLAPVMGPAAAGPAAAGEAAVMGVAGMASYAVGAWNLPTDQIAQVHAGEMIVPAAQAQAFRSAVSGNSGAGMGGNTLNHATNVNISAVDARGVASMFRGNSGAMLKEINRATRNGAALGMRNLSGK